MTDDVNEAEEMRIQTLASDCMAEIRDFNESVGLQARRCWQTRPLEVPGKDIAAESDRRCAAPDLQSAAHGFDSHDWLQV
jgi:hypothetical protein